MMYYFCTYFDNHYLPMGMALYQSLKKHCPSFQLWVLCMDRTCYDILFQLQLPNVHLIPLEDFEAGDEKLLRAKRNRTLIEYYFTCTPSLPLFILDHHPEVDQITYLDADLFFFNSPIPLYDEIGLHSIAIVEHRFSPHLRHSEIHGIYNVGWLSFKRDEHALACLQWWREQCIEWCYDRVEDGRFADQKYLDTWPDRFSGVVVLRHKGANLAPWNISNYTVREDRGHVLVDEQPLIFYHFHGLKKVNDWLYNHNLAVYRVKISSSVLRSIYAPYIANLLKVCQEFLPFFKQASPGSNIRYSTTESASFQQMSPLRRIRRSLSWRLRLCKEILARNYLVVINGRVL
jgi:hypothetical protein